MNSMPLIVAYVLYVLIAGFVVCGFCAARHIDSTKVGPLRKTALLLMGPMVPESALTDIGKRYAWWRNLFFTLLGIVGILSGVVLAILEL